MPKRIRLVSIRLVNFKSYVDYTVDFTNGKKSVQRMTGFHGRNGVGKSTLLDAIGLLFRKFNGIDEQRLSSFLKRYVRNVENVDIAGGFSSGSGEGDAGLSGFSEYSKDRFAVHGKFVVEDGRVYEVEVGNSPDMYTWENGVVSGVKKWHPSDIDESLQAQCYVTTYDKELNKFQLIKSRWDVFKELFTAVSGFEVDKVESDVADEDDRKHLALIDQYVLGLKIKKPGETISDRQCSDGEKKIIKNFTTLLNLQFIPSIILIDNVEMHVEIDRHIRLIQSIEKCFPDSQIIFTTHSAKIIAEAALDMLVSLTNKNISRSDVWRRKMSRTVKAMKLLFNEQQDKVELSSIEADIDNHLVVDSSAVAERICRVLRRGIDGLLVDIKSWAEN